MHGSVLAFFAKALPLDDQIGRSFLEVGSLNVNGSLRTVILNSVEYVGLDMQEGPGVDVVSMMEDYRPGRQFDYVLSAGTLEHCEDWRGVVRKMKDLCKPGGCIVMSTVSPGYPRHNYPDDYWRWTIKQGLAMFRDCEILMIEEDPEGPGWFIKAKNLGKRRQAPLEDIHPSVP